MAIITKIRERAGLAVGVVALSLGLFIVGSDLMSPGSSLFGNKQVVGEINGEDIPYEEMTKEVAQMEYDFSVQQGKNPTEQEMQSLREQAWNQIIFKKLFLPEAENTGLAISDEEKVDMVQGNNIHSAIKQTFVNQETKMFDKSLVENYLRNIEKVEPQQRAAWYSFEAKLPDDRLRTKYEALLTKTNYVTTAEAKREYESQTAKADFETFFVPYSTIADSTIKVTDDELKSYLTKNQYKYKSQDARTLDYVEFKIQPSADDSAYFEKELAGLKEEFKAAENDSAFARSRSDVADVYKSINSNELPADLTANPAALVKGEVYGPFASGNTYNLYKLIDRVNEGEFSARASHILFKADASDTSKANAKKKGAEVLARIKKGESFEEMARQFGSDGTASQGGDLGWFGEKRMVKPFEDAVFNYPSVGLLPNLVETDFGYHIIKVTNPKTNLKYKVATIQRTITPGDQTKDVIYRLANEFKSKIQNQADFDTAVARNPLLVKKTANNLAKSATYVNDIPEARALVQWAFSDDTKIGNVKLSEFNDRYVVAVETKQTFEGPAKLEDVKEVVKMEVIKEKKAAQMLAKVKGATTQEMATAYGPGAVAGNATDIALSSYNLGDFQYDAEAVGYAMGLKPNASTKPFAGANGIGVVKMTRFTPAPETKDYSSYKTQLEQKNQGRGTMYYINEALKEIAKVKDNRVKFM